MKMNWNLLVLAAAHAVLGCSAGGEPVADVALEGSREAPASALRHGIAHYTARGGEGTVELTLLSDRGEALGTLSAVKDVEKESLEIALALSGHHLTVSRSKREGAITLNGRAASFDEARPELETARELLVAEGFLPELDAPAGQEDDGAPALQSLASAPAQERGACANPLRSGCYRSSNQAWACAQAVPGSCLTGYCYESCSCQDDTQWYEWPWTAYVCCSYERCN
ncbi:hypothetical protein WME90_15730 [Sorangium sp. So ce375]|uniref:hypothetical protein n=1 Tax=Sorangium sp. So ce375 TaxID=3133306 RepID=UPI003F5BCC7B